MISFEPPDPGSSMGEIVRLPTRLTSEELVAAIWATAGRVRIPVRGWPMELALDVVESSAPQRGRLRAAISLWPSIITSHGRCRPQVSGLLRDLALSGDLAVEERGWDAGYRPLPQWLVACAAILASLTRPERDVLVNAAQRLVASVTIWSKNALAAGPAISATS